MEQTDKVSQVIESLEQADPLRQPVLQAAIASMKLSPGTYGLDIGCGIGLQALILTQAIQPAGRVTGVDISPGSLAYARRRVSTSPVARQITFKEGDMAHLPFEDNTFDWAWSADCVGYPAGDSLPVLKEIVRVVRPGGKVALLAWTSQEVLPGYTLLEARLNATCSAYRPFLQHQAPEAQFLRLARWFPQADIVNPVYQTFIGEVQAPLEPVVRDALIALFEMLWGGSQGEASLADQQDYKRLCDPQSPEFILDIPEYYAFFTYTMITGIVENSR